MGQIQCAACQSWVSDEAASCPECGAPLEHSPAPPPRPAAVRTREGGLWLTLLVCIPLLLFGGVSFPIVLTLVFVCLVLMILVLPVRALWLHHRHRVHHHP
jgi:hypothetical protein